MGRIIFVTGTDTGVGKTVACAHLAREARESGLDVAYCKPIQTGLAEDEPGDADFVSRTANVEAHELLRLRDPLAPGIAARREAITIDLHGLAQRIREIATAKDTLYVEGAGGLLVPVTDDAVMVDLARILNASLFVVARPGLGTLNHIELTREAAERRGLSIERLVLSNWPPSPGLAEQTNLDYLRQRFSVQVIEHVEALEVDHA